MAKVDNVALEHVVRAYLDAKRAERLSPISLEGYRIILDKFLAYLAGQKKPLKLSQLNAENVRAWMLHLLDTPKQNGLNGARSARSPMTATYYARVLKGLGTWLVEGGYVRENPLASLKLKRPARTVPSVLREEQLQALLYQCGQGHMKERAVALLLFLLDTGLRVSEVCSVARSDVDFEYGLGQAMVTVRRTKGDKPRFVFLSRETCRALDAYLRWRDRRRKGFPEVPNAPLFTRSYGLPLTPDAIRDWLHRLAKRAGITERVHPHMLRHTAATRMIANGANPVAVQQILGHANIQQTMWYTHLAGVDLARAHAAASPVAGWNLRQPRGAARTGSA